MIEMEKTEVLEIETEIMTEITGTLGTEIEMIEMEKTEVLETKRETIEMGKIEVLETEIEMTGIIETLGIREKKLQKMRLQQ